MADAERVNDALCGARCLLSDETVMFSLPALSALSDNGPLFLSLDHSKSIQELAKNKLTTSQSCFVIFINY